MQSENENNKRIAKNTLYLYLRMLVTLIIGLFTSRITLNALGVHDYGLLSVVGGIIGMLDYINNLLSMGSTRFLTAALGKENMSDLKKTFSACATLHFIIALVTLFLGETIGLWFVNNKLVIDPERMFAANWVYQLSLLSCFLTIMQTPYSASVISHEKMSIFAYMSIFDVLSKLIVVYLLLFVDTDKLILYSTFYFVIGFLNIVIYRIYCIRNFEECSFHLGYDKLLYKEIWNYVGWNSIGSFAFLINNQGLTILLNMFYGTVVNAARGIAFTVNEYVQRFVYGFQTAVGPQVIKYCAQGLYKEMNHLILNNAKYSSFLILILGLPIFIETKYTLLLWLGQVPEYVVVFIRLTFVQMLIRAIDSPIGRGIHAYGKMKLPNITSSIVYLMTLPICYLFMHLGASPSIAYLISIFVYPLALIFDLWILRKYTGFDIQLFIIDVCLRILVIIMVSTIIPLIIHFNMDFGFIRFCLVSSTSIIINYSIIFYYGISHNMRKKIMNKKKQKIFLKKKKKF